MCSHSKWDEIDYTYLLVNWRLCANNSVLEVGILLLRRYWKKIPVLKNLKKICPESFSEVSDSPVTFNIAFFTVLFGVWDFFFYAVVAWLKYLCCVRNGEREKVVGRRSYLFVQL